MPPPRRILFLGGNGHGAARLEPAREALARLCATGEIRPLELIDVPYPGFEDRPPAPDRDAFFAAVAEPAAAGENATVYTTGIGALIALALRAQGHLHGSPLILQGPVLWGLERRLMPRLVRRGPLRRLLPRLFAARPFQARFVRRYFTHPPSASLRRAFFDDYRRCPALPHLFAWMDPTLLRHLERSFATNPERLRDITVWWGERDQVVGLSEVRWTEEALGVRFRLRRFPEWGHYPMIDDPEGWIRALAAEEGSG